jgi:hypothetical protein
MSYTRKIEAFLNPPQYLVYVNAKAIVLQGFFTKKPETMLILVEKSAEMPLTFARDCVIIL